MKEANAQTDGKMEKQSTSLRPCLTLFPFNVGIIDKSNGKTFGMCLTMKYGALMLKKKEMEQTTFKDE